MRPQVHVNLGSHISRAVPVRGGGGVKPTGKLAYFICVYIRWLGYPAVSTYYPYPLITFTQ